MPINLDFSEPNGPAHRAEADAAEHAADISERTPCGVGFSIVCQADKQANLRSSYRLETDDDSALFVVTDAVVLASNFFSDPIDGFPCICVGCPILHSKIADAVLASRILLRIDGVDDETGY